MGQQRLMYKVLIYDFTDVVGWWGICMWMCLDFKTTKPMSSMYQLFNVSKLLQQNHHSQVYGTNCFNLRSHWCS